VKAQEDFAANSVKKTEAMTFRSRRRT